jgi:hypothetical protein
MPGMMVRDIKLPSSPPIRSKPSALINPRAQHVKDSSSANAKRFVLGNSNGVNGQSKRNGTEDSTPNVVHDDLLIRLLAQRAMMDANENHVLSQEEIDDLHNVCHMVGLTLGTIPTGNADSIDNAEIDS